VPAGNVGGHVNPRRQCLEQDLGLDAAAEFDQHCDAAHQFGYLSAMMLENADPGADRVLLREPRDGVEQIGAAPGGEEIRRGTLLRQRKAGENLGADVRRLRMEVVELDPASHQRPAASRNPVNCQRSWG
jgi:hypothetical protein